MGPIIQCTDAVRGLSPVLEGHRNEHLLGGGEQQLARSSVLSEVYQQCAISNREQGDSPGTPRRLPGRFYRNGRHSEFF